MHKVYIPIIAVVIAAWAFTIVQWQITSSDLQSCQEDVQSLTYEVGQLQIVTDQQTTTIQEQESLIEDQETEIEHRDIQINFLEGMVETVRFQFYYASLMKERDSFHDLGAYLYRYQWIEGSYVAGEFDCSEMSAYLEWRLENEGYHTIIVLGNAPGGDGRHAWLMVETEIGFWPVEATTYSRVDSLTCPFFDDYFVYDHQFETIQEAIAFSPTEFDWWN